MAKIRTSRSPFAKGKWYCSKCRYVEPSTCYEGPKGRMMHSCGCPVRTRPRHTYRRNIYDDNGDYAGIAHKPVEKNEVPIDVIVGQ